MVTTSQISQSYTTRLDSIILKLEKETQEHWEEIRELGGWTAVVRKEDYITLQEIDKWCKENLGHTIRSLYYPGSSCNLTPLFALKDCTEFNYQDTEKIISAIVPGFNAIIPEYIKEATLQPSDNKNYAELSFMADKTLDKKETNFQKGIINILQNSNVEEEIMSQIKKVDIIFGNNSLVTEDMIANAKEGCIIHDTTGIGSDNFRISDHPELIQRYGLVKIELPLTEIKGHDKWGLYIKGPIPKKPLSF